MGPNGKKCLFSLLLNYLTTSVVTALRAYVMIHHSGAAVRAREQSRNRCEIVGSPQISPAFGVSMFRMCHILKILYIIIFFILQQRLKRCKRIRDVMLALVVIFIDFLGIQIFHHLSVAEAVRMHPLDWQRCADVVINHLG